MRHEHHLASYDHVDLFLLKVASLSTPAGGALKVSLVSVQAN
jgi:hypothetical protein